MQLFLADEITKEQGTLGAEESNHAARVMRLQTGDKIHVTLGTGSIYEAELSSITKKHASFNINKLVSEELRERQLSIAIAPTKSNERFEFFLEKATELGVDQIIPIISTNSERKVYKTERGQKIIKAAAKQSLRHWWPQLTPHQSLKAWLKNHSQEEHKFIAYCGESDKLELIPQLASLPSATVLIGPEGDFTPQEVAMAIEVGFKPVSLGSSRLRTETAGIAVTMAFNLF